MPKSILKLPYPDYSWSLSQHMRRTVKDVRIIFSLLEGAAIFGSDNNYADKITAYVIEKKLVPPNVRGSRPQIWRDYQQVLVELGLIMSTRYTEGVIVTPIGLMWLDGMIGNSELFTTQALRYQYPNAYKISLPNVVRQQMQRSHVAKVESRAELDAKSGILIKPATLILRILLELHATGYPPSITNRECALALMPSRLNKEWPQALANLLSLRQTRTLPSVGVRTLRHIQEWFGLLGGTDIFYEKNNSLILRPQALRDTERLLRVCKYHEDPNSFWFPDPKSSLDEWISSWFGYYGTPELEGQWTMPLDQRTDVYLKKNYIEGSELAVQSEATTKDIQEWEGIINLQPYTSKSGVGEEPTPGVPSKDAVDNIVQGFEKRHASTRLHNRIVRLVAEKLVSAGFSVHEDPLSVDVFASKASHRSILEVKTVTPQTLIPRMRLGVGQLTEYRYRYLMQNGTRPTSVLVLSSAAKFPPWIKDYFQKDINMGLIGLVANDKFVAHTSGTIEKVLSN